MSCSKGGGFDWSKETTKKLIQLYEEHPCLYLPTQADYHNRNIRIQALQKIATELNRRKLTKLTADDVKKKIHGIRTQYLAERQKIKKKEVSGASTDEIYKPKLWCFDQLYFLQQGTAVVAQGDSNIPVLFDKSQADQETPDLQAFEDQEQAQLLECDVLYDGDVDNINDVDLDLLSPSSSTTQCRTWSRGPSQSRTPSRSYDDQGPNKRKRKHAEKDKITGLLTTAVDTLKNLSDSEQMVPHKGTHSLFGQLVAEEMQTITNEEILDELKQSILQNIFAAKTKQRKLL